MQIMAPLKIFLSTVPDNIPGLIISRVCTQLMRGQNFSKKLAHLEDKVICLTVTDTANRFCFRFTSQGLSYLVSHDVANDVDVHIKGSLKTFILLATRNEDPDTLFFNQELSLEGNTEDGLYLRNIMDSLEFNASTHLQNVLGNKAAAVVEPVLERLKLKTRFQALTRSLL